jgi:hypothetical protein
MAQGAIGSLGRCGEIIPTRADFVARRSRVRMDFSEPLENYSRLKTLLRIILAIPIVILRYVMNLLEIGAFAAWVVIVVTGKMPRGLFDLMVLANSYTAAPRLTPSLSASL